MKLFTSLLLAGLSLYFQSNAQVKISTVPGNPHPASLLELESNNRGLLIPRLTQLQQSAVPADAQSQGLLVYNTDSNKLYMYSGAQWRPLSYGDGGLPWLLTGNAGTSPAAQFIGTTDSTDLSFRSNNLQRMLIKANGFIGLHTSNPGSRLTLQNINQSFDSDDVLIENYAPGNGTPSYKIFNYRGTPAAPANLGLGDYIGGLVMGGRANNNFNDFITGIYSFYTGSSGNVDGSNLYVYNGGRINLFIDPQGRVGMGTTNPQAGLELVNDIDQASQKANFMSSSYSTVTWPEFITYRSRGSRSAPQNILPADAVGSLHFDGRIDGNRREVAGIRATFLGSGPNFYTAGRLSFTVGGIRESMVIDSSGMIGIGTRDPRGVLDIVNNAKSDAYDDLRISSYGPNSGPAILVYKSNGTESIPQNLTPGNFLGILAFSGRVGGQDAALSQILASYTGNGTSIASNLEFRTSGVTGMQLNSRGWLSVGAPNFAPTATVDVQGSLGLQLSEPSGTALYTTLDTDLVINLQDISTVNTIALGNTSAFNSHYILLRNSKTSPVTVTTAGTLSCLNGQNCGTLDPGKSAGYIGAWRGGSMQWIQLF